MTLDTINAINRVSFDAHDNAVKHGFYDGYLALHEGLTKHCRIDLDEEMKRNFVLAQLSKIAGEVGECVDVVQRNPDMNGLSEELADVIIRTLDLSEFLCYDIGTSIGAKMEKNRQRPYKHGKLC